MTGGFPNSLSKLSPFRKIKRGHTELRFTYSQFSTAPFGSSHSPFAVSAYDKNVGRLLFFIHKPSSALKDNPLALFLADDGFFAASHDSFNGIHDFFRYQIVALISLRVPLR